MKLNKKLSFFCLILAMAAALAGFSGCKGDGLEVDENGNLIDNSWQEEIPSDKTVVAFDISGSYSLSSGTVQVKNWTNVSAYIYGGSIGDNGWGSWPGLNLSNKCTSNDKIFYAIIDDGKVGTGTCIFNNGDGTQLGDVPLTVAKGKRYIFRNGSFREF